MAPVTTLNVVTAPPVIVYRTAGVKAEDLNFKGIKGLIEIQLAKATGETRGKLMTALVAILEAEKMHLTAKGWK